jgi:hypothetical protein
LEPLSEGDIEPLSGGYYARCWYISSSGAMWECLNEEGDRLDHFHETFTEDFLEAGIFESPEGCAKAVGEMKENDRRARRQATFEEVLI